MQVSTDGGFEPRWSPVGGEIFYRDEDRMMVARVSTSPSVTAGTPDVLFEGNYRLENVNVTYDVMPDGKRFFMVRAADVAPVHEIRVVLNWFEELKQLVPID